MTHHFKLVLSALSATLLLAGCHDDDKNITQHFETVTSPISPPSPTPIIDNNYYQTKTPYLPQQNSQTYSAVPAGFNPIFTELVARHGSRGLSSMKYDLALYNLWQQAKKEGALTPLGEQLGADLEKMMAANILLGYGVEGITNVGYGNETQTGIQEHQGIADRLLLRLPTLFNQASAKQQTVQVVSSGVDRAVDSAKFFTNELIKKEPNLNMAIVPQSYTSFAKDSLPTVANGGVNHFLLYFHSLNTTDDKVTDTSNPNYPIYTASQNYQNFIATNPDLLQKLKSLSNDPKIQDTAMQVLTPLFQPAFISKIGQSGYTFSNTGSFSATAKDGTVLTQKGNGKSTIAQPVDAAAYLYELYSISGGMANELGNTDFKKYMPTSAAQFYAQFNDANDFYQKGPSFTESNNITSIMAQGLKQDFFTQVDNIVAGTQKNTAVLRFTHAEVMIPLATTFELKGMMNPLPLSQTYSYQTSTWRGIDISPMAANMQWDIYRNNQKKILVRLLYNEKETSFKPACDNARYANTRYFYEYDKLKLCYGMQ